MGRYLALWEIDNSRVPVDANEWAEMRRRLMAMVEQDMKAGKLKEWGAFFFERRGYAVYEGTEVEVDSMLGQYTPYGIFKVHPVITLDQLMESLQTR